MYKSISLLIILFFVGFNSCKKDSGDPAYCAGTWATEIQAEINALNAAMTAYIATPNHTTCVAYKDAYQDYIDAMKPFLNCSAWTAQQKEDLQDAIDQAEAEVADLCDE